MEYDEEIRRVRLDYERALDEVLSRQAAFYDNLRYNLGARLDKRSNLSWNEIQVCLESRMTELEQLRDNPVTFDSRQKSISQIINDDPNITLSWSDIISRIKFFVNEIDMLKIDIKELTKERDTLNSKWTGERNLILKTNDDLNTLLKKATLEKDIALSRANDLQKLNESLHEENGKLREKISSMQDDAQQATHLLCKHYFNPTR